VNELIHQPTRLKIVATLNALRGGAKLEFTELRKLLGVTDGNLAHTSPPSRMPAMSKLKKPSLPRSRVRAYR